ncbi:hypothetical protein BGZ67_008164 [Mortierella alpina]|nr:hypothetical protein BGZ67_008164 [Mortierella alpina]
MNEHLDRQPIPLSWHTLAMIHQDAQSKSLEEIEKKFNAPDCRLPQLLQEFRAHCMETGTTTSPGAGSENAGSPAANVVSPMSELEAIVPTGGLYLEYYSANASALQNHHLVTLDEHWQVLLKNRLLSAQNITAAAATTSSLVSPALGTTSSSTNIKDHASFLLAVDQVRRNYLETCIPSPEAISVLENLDEMQQAESALLLKSLAAAAASAAAANISPRSSLPVHLRRYSLTSPSSSSQSILPPSIRELRLLTEVLRENKSESHTTHAAVENKSSSSSSSSNGGHVRATTLSTHQMQHMQQMQQMQQAPTELEQQISEILRSKRRANTNELQGSRQVALCLSNDSTHSSNRQGAQAVVKAQGSSSGSSSTSNGVATTSKSSTNAQGGTTALSSATATFGTTSVTSSSNSLLKESDNKSVVQFGWTLHMLHANTLQYAWIWTWLYIHEGSSRQNVGKYNTLIAPVACDSKMYTASKWIILPAKDLVRTRKDWKVSYGDRVWMVSYWFSTRNAKMDLPEYLPRARGAACRHVIPYGETYVICKTCPADILCMRCFRASDHTDHTIQKSYSGLAKGKPCQIKFKAGEKVYRCKTCLVGRDESVVLCSRCFRSHNHFGHEVTAYMAEEGSVCSCHDNKSWRPDLHCTYHSPGILESEYFTRPLSLRDTSSARHPYSQEQPSSSKKRSKGTPFSSTSRHLERSESGKHGSSTSLSFKPITAKANPIQPHRCGHIFQPGEDIYHCRDCSFNDRVILCSRCFHSSGCVDHRWRMGEFQSQKTRAGEYDPADVPGEDSTGRSISPSITVEGLAIGHNTFNSARTELSTDRGAKPLDANLCPPVSIAEDASASYGGSVGTSCDCGDPEMFKTVFDCNYHLPQEYRPVPSLIHCNYLFQQGETMFRCRTCHFDGTDTDAFAADQQGQDSGLHAEALEQEFCNRGPGSCLEADVWICERCFDPEQHIGHVLEEAVNHQNRGAYCHCGDIAILKDPHARPSAVASSVPGAILTESEALYACKDDHNRQNMLCTTDIKEGMLYYSCKTCQTDPKRVFCEPCFIKEAHKDHEYEQLPATTGFEPIRCGCGENKIATPTKKDKWLLIFASGVVKLVPPNLPPPSISISGNSSRRDANLIRAPPLCQYHTMIYKTTPSTTLYLHSHDYRSINHQDHSEVTGYRYHDSNNDWIVTRPDEGGHSGSDDDDDDGDSGVVEQGNNHARQNGRGNAKSIKTVSGSLSSTTKQHAAARSPFLQWKDVFWLKHAATGKYFNSMASLKISQGFQEVSAFGAPHSNNDWIIEETTWLRQQILSDE